MESEFTSTLLFTLITFHSSMCHFAKILSSYLILHRLEWHDITQFVSGFPRCSCPSVSP